MKALVISGLVLLAASGAGVVHAINVINPNTNYENKLVEVTETPLNNGCTLVEYTIESKHGDNTNGVREFKQVVACPQAPNEEDHND